MFSLFRLCHRRKVTINSFDIVAVFGNQVELLPIASTLLLVWTVDGLYVVIVF